MVNETPEASDLALEVLRLRDDLECVALLLDEQLDREFVLLDEQAITRGALFAEIPLPYCERLGAVSWQEPDAWWGAIAIERMR